MAPRHMVVQWERAALVCVTLLIYTYSWCVSRTCRTCELKARAATGAGVSARVCGQLSTACAHAYARPVTATAAVRSEKSQRREDEANNAPMPRGANA